jgi:hypothetical protein
MLSCVGCEGMGLWQDDTAWDVRAMYREALEDRLTDEQATEMVLSEFAGALADDDVEPVVWLALAVCQHQHGRLTPEIRDRALAVIDTGADLQQLCVERRAARRTPGHTHEPVARSDRRFRRAHECGTQPSSSASSVLLPATASRAARWTVATRWLRHPSPGARSQGLAPTRRTGVQNAG